MSFLWKETQKPSKVWPRRILEGETPAGRVADNVGVNLDLLSPIFLLRIKWGVSLSDFCYHHRFGSQEHKVTLFKLKQVGILKNNLTLKMVWRFLQKSRNRTNIWSSNSTSGYLSKGNENVNSKRYMHRHVHSSIIYNSQAIETTCVHR